MTAWTEHTIETAQGARCRCASIGKRSGAAPVVLHLHGGAFTGGSVEASRTAAGADRAGRRGRGVGRLSARAGASVSRCARGDVRRARRAAALLRPMGEPALGGVRRGRGSRRQSRGRARADGARPARRRSPDRSSFRRCSIPCMGTCSLRSAEAGAVGCPWADGWHAYLGSPDKAAHPYAAPLSATPPRRRRARAGADARRTIRCATRA